MDAELIVLGGGCAGLSLAGRLAASKRTPRVVVLERRTAYRDDRTWCFWERADRADRIGPVRRRWQQWRFSDATGSVTHRATDDFAYQCIRSIDFYDQALARLNATDRVELLLGQDVRRVRPLRGGGFEVDTAEGALRARQLLDTRPAGVVHRAALRQVFSGVEVHADRPVFDPDVVGLMQDMTVDEHGFHFTYVLPFTATHALIEATRFSAAPGPLNAVVAADLERTLDRLPIPGAIHRGRREHGALPMDGDAVQPSRTPGVVTAGTAGGAVRPSSGYAFLRIQAWASACAARLEADGAPIPHPPDPRWRRGADQLFLRVIRARPDIAPVAFMAMARHLEPRSLVRFLSDDSTFADFIRVASVLPKAPFLKALGASATEAALGWSTAA